MPHTTTTRRLLLSASALAGVAGPAALARSVQGTLPWQPGEVYPSPVARPGPWQFFTAEEGATIEAIVDRLIPADERSLGGKDAGCAVFIDRQLAGPYGRAEGMYMQGPHPEDPLPTQGFQSPLTPAQQYRRGLAALAAFVTANFNGRRFPQLSGEEQDKLLTAMEKNEVQLQGYRAATLFNHIHSNTMEGYFADPIYGGNKDMTGWKLLGFPGARYDFRDVLDRPNQRYTTPPVALMGRPEWRVGGRS